MIRNHGGMAIRFWKNWKNGRSSSHPHRVRWHEGERYLSWGRAWLVEPVQEAPGNVVLFNPYGISLYNAARIMAKHLNTDYHEIGLSLHGQNNGMLYINDDGAMLIGSGAHEYIDLTWDKCWVICSSCDNPFRFSPQRKNQYGDILCSECWYD